MTSKNKQLTGKQAWKALIAHHASGIPHFRDLFTNDPKRGEKMTAEAKGLFLDYSKNRITDETFRLLLRLATESGLKERIEAMFRGEKINITENRAVLHVALRAPADESIIVDGVNVVPQVHDILDKMTGFADRIKSGSWKGLQWQMHKKYHQYWNWRIRPWSCNGLRGAQVLQ